MAQHKSQKETSWGKVAEWYGEYLENPDSYQAQVLLPNLLRVLDLQPTEKVLDLACGQGFFTKEFLKTRARVIGTDISKELIIAARANVPEAKFFVTPASDLSFARDAEFDTAVCVLALQNIEDMGAVCKEVSRVLKRGGRFVLVVNHPTFRVLKRSSWGWDKDAEVQYRRIDGYLSGAKIPVNMHPGKSKKVQTISYHRSLQDFCKALFAAGFAITRMEEWISHKVSEKGPRQKAEDTARKEIPLFMTLEAKII